MNNRKLILVIFLGVTLAIVMYLSFKLPNDEATEIIRDHYQVVGLITHVGFKTVIVNYSVDGKVYQYTRSKPYSGLSEGEEFFTLASKRNLNRALVFFTKPIIDTTKYDYAQTNPIDVDVLWVDDSELSFTYKVGTKEYDRIQKFERGRRADESSKMVVMYRVDRPEIGYLVKQTQ